MFVFFCQCLHSLFNVFLTSYAIYPFLVIPLVKNKEHRKKWNEAYIDTDLIEDKAEYKIMRPMFKAGATATNRDFCVFFASYESETEFVDAQTSIEDSRCPPTKSFVRGTCFFSGTRMIAESATRTKVYYVGQLDLGGWVPAFIGNSINLKQPLCIAKIRDYSAKLPAEKQ